MIGLGLIGLAVVAAKPEQAIYKVQDYPQEALRAGEQGFVLTRSIITPEGRPENCIVYGTSGSKSLDHASCEIMMRRAHFSPARDENGLPVYGVYLGMSAWTLPSPGQIPKIPGRYDLALFVSKLPAGETNPIYVPAALMISKDGSIAQCDATPPEKAAILGKIACDQLKAQLDPKPVHNQAGDTVRAIQGAVVRFSMAPTGMSNPEKP